MQILRVLLLLAVPSSCFASKCSELFNPAAEVEADWKTTGGGVVKLKGWDDNGAVLLAEELKEEPILRAEGLEPEALYLILMQDPDAPSPEQPKGTWNHWLKYNVSAKDLSSGDTRLTYHRPSPPKGSSPHRYLIAVYKQEGNIDLEQLPADSRLYNFWDARVVLGDTLIHYDEPVAWMCFQATSDPGDVREAASSDEKISPDDALRQLKQTLSDSDTKKALKEQLETVEGRKEFGESLGDEGLQYLKDQLREAIGEEKYHQLEGQLKEVPIKQHDHGAEV